MAGSNASIEIGIEQKKAEATGGLAKLLLRDLCPLLFNLLKPQLKLQSVAVQLPQASRGAEQELDSFELIQPVLSHRIE